MNNVIVVVPPLPEDGETSNTASWTEIWSLHNLDFLYIICHTRDVLSDQNVRDLRLKSNESLASVRMEPAPTSGENSTLPLNYGSWLLLQISIPHQTSTFFYITFLYPTIDNHKNKAYHDKFGRKIYLMNKVFVRQNVQNALDQG